VHAPFFDELRDPASILPNGKPLPSNLFNFSEQELAGASSSVLTKLIPAHAKSSSKEEV